MATRTPPPPMQNGAAPTTKKAKLSHDLVWRSIKSIRTSPENDQLYLPIDLNCPEMVEMARSVDKFGVKEPLVITSDGYILSGHRRYAAAKVSGLKRVRCRIEPIRRADPQFLVLLREYNRQRIKSFDEIVREEIVSAEPGQAHRALVEYRRKKVHVTIPSIQIVGIKVRCAISKAKLPFLRAVQRILQELLEYLPVSVRTVHYWLLNVLPRRHAGKPASVYRNDLASYKALVELVTRARVESIIPMESIIDETRPQNNWDVFPNPGPFIRREFDGLFQNYSRDLQRSQPNHIEILCEKNTVTGIVRPVASDYCIPMTSGRGYCSLRPRHDMAERFRRSGKDRLIVLILSDFDPDGEEIAHSFVRSMRDDFGIENVQGVQVALTAEQVRELKLPPSMEAKRGSANYKKFVAEHGTNAYELEALPPSTLQKLLRDAVDRALDLDAFNRELDQEKEDAAHLADVRQRVLRAFAASVMQNGSQ